jgi:DNA mismatch repair protein MutL
MSNRIHLLPDHVANQIAAGEVVQRPASVVKELLENAIDSGASKVELVVRDGGKMLIHVVDNGCGMNPEDALLSFKRHATSKISDAKDLFNLHTKGFRGEALASIAAIAQVEMLTREANSELGTCIRISGDTVSDVEEAVAPLGTSIQVKNLFFNIPARRNFLKSSQVEYRHVMDEFHRVVLAHPSIAFRLVHNDSEVFNLTVTNLRQRIDQVFGNRMLDRLVPVAEETQIGAISGFICKPEFARKSRGEQFFFVNDRFIKSPYLHHAILSAFEGLIRPEQHPGYFIYFKVPPDSIDINIHPTKTEVKFQDEQSLYAILRSAVKHSLGQFNIAPILDFESDPGLDTPYHFKNHEAKMPGISVDRNFNPFQNQAQEKTKSYYKSMAGPAWQALYEGIPEQDDLSADRTEWVIESDSGQEALFNTSESEMTGVMSLFQVDKKYIVTRVKSGILVIDQNRAHQRIVYEKLLTSISQKQPDSQVLLFPVQVTFGPPEILILESILDELHAMGFAFTIKEEGEVSITALPALIPAQNAKDILDEIMEGWLQHEGAGDLSPVDRLAKTLCRSMAVKNGILLDNASQQGLVHDLFACKEPDLSPFNKPIHVRLSVEDLDKKINNYG